MLTLFHAPRSRSTRFLWLLEELGAPYEVTVVDIKRAGGPLAGTGARDPRNPHPHGQVPALLDDGALVTESAAIALYLTDKFPQAGLGAGVGDAKRGTYLSWLAYTPGCLNRRSTITGRVAPRAMRPKKPRMRRWRSICGRRWPKHPGC